jgi:uroporphyrinogen decarboxylase
MKASGIAVEAYHELMLKLGLASIPRVLDSRFMIAVVEDPVLKRFGIDIMPLDVSAIPALLSPEDRWIPRRLFSGNNVLFPPGTSIQEDTDGSWMLLNEDGTPSSFRMPKNGYYFDDISFNREQDIDPANFKPISDIPDEVLKQIDEYSSRLWNETDYALLGWGGGICFLGLSLITERRSNVTMGMPDEWMMMLMTEKETCHEMMDRSVDASIKCLTLLHQVVGDRCFAWGIAADDSGTQQREFINPNLWVEMIKPHYQKLCRWIHRNTAWKTFLHCCGSIYHLIPHFIDVGVDILNPVQTSAANMEPSRLKREFGGRIVLWGGGCDTQSVLERAMPDEIREHVRERLAVFAPGGGYVFNQVHNIQRNVPAENVIAMLNAALEYGVYHKG